MKRDYLSPITIDGKVTVSDPCLENGVWCQICNLEVLPGDYHPYIEYNEETWRVHVLSIWHEDYEIDEDADFDEELMPTVVVDSGQAGFFDSEYFASYCDNDCRKADTPWYAHICALTIPDKEFDRHGADTFDGRCAVSSSGWGDGNYVCSVKRDASGRIYALKLTF
jgi:hypothetical protein